MRIKGRSALKIEIETWTGWLAIALLATIWDILGPRRGKPTLSYTVWSVHKDPIRGPLFVGVWAGLTWHLLFASNATGERARHLDIVKETIEDVVAP
jgi:hypothetical protein